MMKNVQSGIYLYWIGNWIGSFPLCCFLDWLMFLLKNVQSGKSMYLIWNWIGLFLDDMIWWWWYDGEPTYWDLELDWLISLLTFMMKKFPKWYIHVLDWKLDWVISSMLFPGLTIYSCLKMSKVVSPCIWFGIGLVFLLMIGYDDDDMMVNLCIGIWNWVG